MRKKREGVVDTCVYDFFLVSRWGGCVILDEIKQKCNVVKLWI